MKSLQPYDKSSQRIIPIRNGLGDNIVFLKVLSEIQGIYGTKQIVIGTAYPEVYKHHKDLITIDIYEAAKFVDINEFNVYKFMTLNNWRTSFVEAYRMMLIQNENNIDQPLLEES